MKQSPEFDPRNYGYRKLGELVAATKLFDIEERQVGDSNSKALYVRDKKIKSHNIKLLEIDAKSARLSSNLSQIINYEKQSISYYYYPRNI